MVKAMLHSRDRDGRHTADLVDVEIVEEVGEENAFIFGLSADEVLHLEQTREYNPRTIYDYDKDLHKVIDQLVDGTYASDKELFPFSFADDAKTCPSWLQHHL